MGESFFKVHSLIWKNQMALLLIFRRKLINFLCLITLVFCTLSSYSQDIAQPSLDIDGNGKYVSSASCRARFTLFAVSSKATTGILWASFLMNAMVGCSSPWYVTLNMWLDPINRLLYGAIAPWDMDRIDRLCVEEHKTTSRGDTPRW